jgi:hypothetical protein
MQLAVARGRGRDVTAQSYLTHSLNRYDGNPVWTSDPKRTVFREAAKRSLTAGGLGSVGEKAANAISDFVLVDMCESYCTGREDAKDAIKIAERQLQRIYRQGDTTVGGLVCRQRPGGLNRDGSNGRSRAAARGASSAKSWKAAAEPQGSGPRNMGMQSLLKKRIASWFWGGQGCDSQNHRPRVHWA